MSSYNNLTKKNLIKTDVIKVDEKIEEYINTDNIYKLITENNQVYRLEIINEDISSSIVADIIQNFMACNMNFKSGN